MRCLAQEQDDRVAFFYLHPVEDRSFGVRPCWIRNLRQAPEKFDRDVMKQGLPPMLPRECCAHPQGATALSEADLRMVWFPEGDAVALLEKDEILAVIPSWGGRKGLYGYARDCIRDSPLSWPLRGTVLEERVRAAEGYWSAWEDDSPWRPCQTMYLDEYERVLGKHSRYFAIDGDRWPPKALVRFDSSDCTVLLTVGVSLRPQPQVEMYCRNPSEYRRFELAACFAKGIGDETIMSFGDYLSGQANHPWDHFTFLGNGHTIGCDVFSKDERLAGFSAVLLLEQPRGIPEIRIPRMDGDRVMLLWCIPVTAHERKLAEEKGSKELVRAFVGGQPAWIIEGREEVV